MRIKKLPEYGFILRYLVGKEHITGYAYEPRHIRYVDDPDIAKEITEKGITLDEYLGGYEAPDVDIDMGESELFGPEELEEAVVQLKCAFAKFEGCELHNISYAGDEANSDENIKWLNDIGEGQEYTQCVEFFTNFRSPVEGGGAWNQTKSTRITSGGSPERKMADGMSCPGGTDTDTVRGDQIRPPFCMNKAHFIQNQENFFCRFFNISHMREFFTKKNTYYIQKIKPQIEGAKIMKNYVAVDCGKYNTKVDFYKEDGSGRSFKFRTKMDAGTFADDMFDRGTFIVQVDDGPVYKVGFGAQGESEMETSKKTEIHRVCTMTAIAMALGEGSHDSVHVVVGIPLMLCNIPEERIAYKNFILGADNESHKVLVKTDPNGEPWECSFVIEKRLVYPEGIGVLYEYPGKLNGPTALIDIGNLNTSHLYCDSFSINMTGSFTDELGGKVMIAELAQKLSSELGSRCDETLAASTLLKDYEHRYLHPINGDKEIERRSKEIIDEHLLDHVRTIKTKCDTKRWPLAFMNVVCVGGTSRLLQKEIKEIFGENAFIPDAPEFVNVKGFLKKMCADEGIDITKAENGDEKQ